MPARRNRRISSAKKNRLTPVAKYLVLIAILAILGLVLWRLVDAWANRLWKDGSRITVVVADQPPVVFSYNPENASITQFVVPANTQLDTSGGYGSWLAGSLWDLGVQEKVGGQILSRSVQRSFGIPVNGWTGKGGNILFSGSKLGLFSLINIQSNLTFFDKVNLLFASSRVRKLSRTTIDLERQGIVKTKTLADGTAGFVIIDKSVSRLDTLKDDKVLSEEKTLKITNSSSVSGLALQVSRVSSTLGLRVISTDTIKDKVLGICTVRGKDSELKSFAAQRLLDTFGCGSEVGDPSGPTNLEMILGAKFPKEF
ncbi:MAG: hypothetical protein HYW33_01730 [Candidatus Blackburnbacteria bacterium]|nr:hypothetical protein [Candidatus Blackburnbacteria bacterium]